MNFLYTASYKTAKGSLITFFTMNPAKAAKLPGRITARRINKKSRIQYGKNKS